MPDQSRIDLYLGNTYHAINRGNAAEAEAAFRSLINADQTFRAEAEAKLVSLTSAIRQRDHISRVYHDILTRMLNAD